VAYEKTIQTAYGDAERALITLEADRRRVGLLTSATERSRFAYNAAQEGYRMGLIDLTSAIQAEQTWRQTRAALTSAQVSVLLDAVTACKALGGGWNAESARSVRS
jgi:outer membrane protein TolC